MAPFDIDQYTEALYQARDALWDFIEEKHQPYSPPHGLARRRATKLYIEPIKKQFPILSYADIIQLAGALAVEHAGGPRINMRYGRLDDQQPSKEGALPGALAPWEEKTPRTTCAWYLGE
ncbi:L-ascorbate peroxidase 2, cytosolic [Batrachochytrium salamandrivorans]|nr:L-ascorbate peroxidase 2, cytosolic [Batrachochytrium salamandrivorans]